MSAVAFAGGVRAVLALQRRFNLHLHHPPRLERRRLFFDAAIDGVYVRRRAHHGQARQRLAAALAALLVRCPVVLAAAAFRAGARAALWPPVSAHSCRHRRWRSSCGCCCWSLARPCSSHIASASSRWCCSAWSALAVSLTFVYFSAPDLALTQLSVEMVTTVLMLMAPGAAAADSPRESTHCGAAAMRCWRWPAAAAWPGWPALVMTRDHDPISLVLPRRRPCPAAAAPTSST